MALPIIGIAARAFGRAIIKDLVSSKFDKKDPKAYKGVHFSWKWEKGPGFDREAKRLAATPREIANAVRDEVIDMAVRIRNIAIRSMQQTPKTGNRYRKTKNKNIYHIASSPGYPPARDTGMLVRSIKMDVRSTEVEVGSNLTGKAGMYPTYLEFGTKKMDPRPWLEPAYDKSRMEFYATVRSRVNKAIRKAK